MFLFKFFSCVYSIFSMYVLVFSINDILVKFNENRTIDLFDVINSLYSLFAMICSLICCVR